MNSRTSRDWFDEAGYLRMNPDVAQAIAAGALASGYDHYVNQGWREQRVWFDPGAEPKDRVLRTLPPGAAFAKPLAGPLPCSVESIARSPDGGLLITGWMIDWAAPVASLRLVGDGWSYSFSADAIARLRRPDVETVAGSATPYAYGFFAFAFLDQALPIGDAPRVEFALGDGSKISAPVAPQLVDDVELRHRVLSYIGQSDYIGDARLEAARLLDGPLGRNIIAHNQFIVERVKTGACVQYFGAPSRALKGSIIICLYGKAEYFFLQHALFCARPGFEDYELIYVSNSPELAERLMAEARTAQLIYGVPVTLVLLSGNAGFGAANNVAAGYARSDRLLIVNPDIFPRQTDWAQRHTAAVEELPENQTKLFGTSLYYDDGSLMHGGMFFELDSGVSPHHGTMVPRELVRVEHYGKGVPYGAQEFVRSRAVPAVTGAFISVARDWFEDLEGFSEDFVFGHYEDADLCMKSLRAGQPAWLHDIKLWHLEGKGSTRVAVHEAGSLVNRWLFSQRWLAAIKQNVRGPNPTHPLLLGAGVRS